MQINRNHELQCISHCFRNFCIIFNDKTFTSNEKKENSNVIIVGTAVPPIRNSLRFGKREENFSYMKNKFFYRSKELNSIQNHWKNKKKNMNKNLQHIIVETIEIFKRK